MWFVPFSLRDLVDILLVAMIMFWIYRATKGTNAPYILTGIIAIYMLWVVVKTLNMELLSSILGQIISVGVIAMIVVFQPEIRRFLQMIGMRQKRLGFIMNIFSSHQVSSTANIDPIVVACADMAASRTGALIVIGQQSDLRLITDGGVALDAKLSTQLLKNIFFKNSPLHDGAVVLAGDRVVAAKCILPVTQSETPQSYGTRHLAAIGISEISDAVVLVVSEESGQISIAQGGHLYRNLETDRLTQILQRFLSVSRRRETAEEVRE
ncbi:MAG: diadenylate cyclase CdaA [Rikenellaceae bacterium]